MFQLRERLKQDIHLEWYKYAIRSRRNIINIYFLNMRTVYMRLKAKIRKTPSSQPRRQYISYLWTRPRADHSGRSYRRLQRRRPRHQCIHTKNVTKPSKKNIFSEHHEQKYKVEICKNKNVQ